MQLSNFLENFQSAVLGTLGSNGYPFSSYAPFYYDEERIYIFISDIATHAQNIQHTPRASLLFIEDESKSQQIFARKRITLQCDVTPISRHDSYFEPTMKAFIAKQGETLQMLMSMQDFHLYALTPMYGEATFGFGEAYHLGGDKMDILIPRSANRGHSSNPNN